MNCLTWNLEWAPANSRRASLILENVPSADMGLPVAEVY